MDIMDLAKGMLAEKIGGNSDAVGDVVGNLLGSAGEGGTGGLDLGSIVSGLQSKGLGDVAESWLGDGENADISTDQIKDVLGGEKIADAAAQLGTDEGSLLSGLQEALPQLIDKSSNGGSLIGSLGGLSGIAKKFL